MGFTLAEILAMCIVATLWNILLFVILVRGNLPAPKKKGEPLSICFIHPDLGLGGAEMLVVETAVALTKLGHHVEVFTSYHDSRRAFTETTDGTLDIHVHDSIVPRSIFGRFVLPLAHIRFFWTSAKLMMRHKNIPGGYDIIFVDQISSTIPLLKYSGAKVVYYCHFPDLLLSERKSLLKRLYRYPLDFLEEITTASADTVLVNSNFTREVYRRTFKTITKEPIVIYPTVSAERITNDSKKSLLSPSTARTSKIENLSPEQTIHYCDLCQFLKNANTKPQPQTASCASIDQLSSSLEAEIQDTYTSRYILSVNRFERKKNISLAIDAMAVVLQSLDPKEKEGLKLVIAGGYDPRLAENVEYYEELKLKAEKAGIKEYIKFFTKVPDAERNQLLWGAKMVLYTPENEHFGIVPLEAGVALKPVIACNSGGPLESIVNGETGFLVPPDASKWAEKILLLLRDDKKCQSMGENAVKRVITHFSPNVIIPQLERIMYNLTEAKPE